MKLIFSPYLYCNDSDTFNLFPLEQTLDFITTYLELTLDSYNNAFYSEERLICPPITEYNRYAEYSQVINMLRKLQIGGDVVNIANENSDYFIDNFNYNAVNQDEFQIISNYINEVDANEFMLFLGERNYKLDTNNLEIAINKIRYKCLLVKNPWLEKSDAFNMYIISNFYNSYFPHGATCEKFENYIRIKEKGMSQNDKVGLYREYFEIIAKRNGYTYYNMINGRKYYLSKDGRYRISCDTTHGGFEVFSGATFNDHEGQYDFSCNFVKSETKKNKGTHKL